MRARIVPPCTILASGFVRTKPAYLQLSRRPWRNVQTQLLPAFIRPDTRSGKLYVNKFRPRNLKQKTAQGRAVFCPYAVSPPILIGVSIPPLCAHTSWGYASTLHGAMHPVTPPEWDRHTRSSEGYAGIVGDIAPLCRGTAPHYRGGVSPIIMGD